MALQWILERIVHRDIIELCPEEAVYTVGRGKENSIKCLSLYVSRKHCKILQKDGNLTIVDLKSANGTFVNQTRILAEREIPLQEGDLIGMGVCETTDKDCYVFKLYQKALKIVPVLPLPDSSTTEHELVVITDSDSEKGTGESREAQAKEVSRKRNAEWNDKQEPKVPCLEKTTIKNMPSCSLKTSENAATREVNKVPDMRKDEVSHCKQDLKSSHDLLNNSTDICSRSAVELEDKVNSSYESKSVMDVTVQSKQVERLSPSELTVSENVQNKFDSAQSSPVDGINTSKDVNNRHRHSSNDSSIITPILKRRFDSLPISNTIVAEVVDKDISRTESLTTNVPVVEVRKGSHVRESSQEKKMSGTSTSVSGGLTKHSVEFNSNNASSKVIQPLSSALRHMISGDENIVDITDCDDDDVTAVEQKTNNSLTTCHEIGVHNMNATVCKDSIKKRSLVDSDDSNSKTVTEVKSSVSETSSSSVLSVGAVKHPGSSKKHLSVTNKDSFKLEGNEITQISRERLTDSSTTRVETTNKKNLVLLKENDLQEKSSREEENKRKSSKSEETFAKLTHIISSDKTKELVQNCLEKPSSAIKFRRRQSTESSEKPSQEEWKLGKRKSENLSELIVCEKSKKNIPAKYKIDSHLLIDEDGNNEDNNDSDSNDNIIFTKRLGVDCNISLTESNRKQSLGKENKQISKSKGSEGDKFTKSETLSETVMDDEPLIRNEKKRRRCRFISSSSSDEDIVFEKNKKRSNSVALAFDSKLKENRKLSSSSDNSNFDSNSLRRNNFESASDRLSVKSDLLEVDSKDCSKSANVPKVDDELIASICKNKPVVKLERLDKDILNPSDCAAAKSENDSLNYTLDEDIIVISDDDDEYFPSSQIFDEQKPPTQSNKDRDVLEDMSFNRVPEDDDDDGSVFVDDDSDLEEDQWFKRLSQQEVDPEPLPEPAFDKLKNVEIKKEDSRDVLLQSKIIPHTSCEDGREEPVRAVLDKPQKITEFVSDNLLKADIEAQTKQNESSTKSKLSGKLMIIDAPPMPPRRASQRGISAEEATRIYKERKEQKKLKSISSEKSKCTVSDASFLSPKLKLKKNSRRSSAPPEDLSNLSARQKKQIADQRKEKLKALTEKEKAAAAASKEQSTRVPAKVRIKVTRKNRGAFLTEGADDTEDELPTAQTTVSGVKKSSHIAEEKLVSSKNLKEQGTVKSNIPAPKKIDSRSSSAPSVDTIKNLPRIPKLSGRPSSVKSANAQVPSKISSDVEFGNASDNLPKIQNLQLSSIKSADADVPPKISSNMEFERVSEKMSMSAKSTTDIYPLRPIIKSLTATKCKEKKRVRFKSDSELVAMRTIPVEENSRLLPVAHKKDAPTPRKVVNNQQLFKGPNLQEVLYDILCWNPLWLEEQKGRSASEPPPVHGNKLWPMLSSFVSYKDYLNVLTPLLQLELWTRITNDSDNNPDERKVPVIVGIDHVNCDPASSPNKKQLMYIGCHAVLTEFESQKQQHPRMGDLVYLELELEDQPSLQSQGQSQSKLRRVVPIFAYVDYVSKEAVTGSTIVHKEILKHSNRPKTKISFLLWAKYRPYNVKTSHAMRVKVVSYIKHELRLFQAMAYLPSSPLCDSILKPEQQDYTLPDLRDQTLVPLIKQETLNDTQKRAILQTAFTCLKSEPKICMIQGPPGTGKSHVIVNLILQILYSYKQYRKYGSRKNSPRILLCAPSNAAVDELVLRLLQVRQKIRKEDRFKMVRTGRQEIMNSAVKEISVIELAKRDARNMTQSMENIESVDLEIRNLEARRNSLGMALDSAKQKNNEDSMRETEFKLVELERKLFQMRRCKTQNTALDPREIRRMETDAQTRLLLGADIVATTLSSCFSNQMEHIFTKENDGREKSVHPFTCCIIDEATQSQEVETLIPLMLGVTTLVLVGDAKQLPGTVLSKVAKDNGLGKSLFARLQECFEDTVKNPVQFLGTQYRMHSEICMWPNRFFYSGRLHTASNLSAERVCPLVPYCILSLEYKQHDNGELSNAGEAELVSQLTVGILEKLGTQLSIGIITPYHKQRAMISKILQFSSHLSKNVEVNTIDSFQGQERDVIVMSCVRTGGIGFLADSQRLNVALTRARYSLLLCGNFTSLRNDNMWRALLENAEKRNVLKHVPLTLARNKDDLMKMVLRETNTQPV